MAKRAKRRPFRRPNPQQRREDDASKQRRLESAANSLLSRQSADQIQADLPDLTLLLEEADRVAQLDPSPANLARYREAVQQHAAARLALKMTSNNGAES